jgi:transcriptional regulator with XRE-family HTH domain
MDQSSKKRIGQLIKEGRATKGYTQQELSELTGISLRSIQRIENKEVLPRSYTMRLLADQLGITGSLVTASTVSPEIAAPKTASASSALASPAPLPSLNPTVRSPRLNKTQKIILSIGTGVLLILGASAFIVQSRKFPETEFESLLLWMSIAAFYLFVLFRLWK